MDPNATLQEINALAAEDCPAGPDSVTAMDCDRLRELCRAIDGWIRNGGFLPDVWQRTDAPPVCPHDNCGTCRNSNSNALDRIAADINSGKIPTGPPRCPLSHGMNVSDRDDDTHAAINCPTLYTYQDQAQNEDNRRNAATNAAGIREAMEGTRNRTTLARQLDQRQAEADQATAARCPRCNDSQVETVAGFDIPCAGCTG